MIRATTVTHIFPIPDDPADVDEIIVSYRQGSIRIDKRDDDITKDSSGRTVSVTLSQEETRSFRAGDDVEVQIRYLKGSTVRASHIRKIEVHDVIYDTTLPEVDEG